MDKKIEELLPFYALDALTDEEKELVEAYLVEHPEVRAQVGELQSAVDAIPYGVKPVEPPRRLKNALMARVAARLSPQVVPGVLAVGGNLGLVPAHREDQSGAHV